ncbi:acyl-coenzyme A thioesterase 9, mitochondrial isoform X1 [Drosophila nasuta]|uniref:acyl-coenzyme A thioesterase 9, mitochondrial isoform X1 n=2 Tax=Drosophila nasuta TaxID=42062 RepID=UPI00295E7262|nr:acyl-coenzyme A thioesterase 9, mitochondrial isoform X1 [Drosophila nasuta]
MRSVRQITLCPSQRNWVFCLRTIHRSAIMWQDKCEFEEFQSGHCAGTIEDVAKKIQRNIGVKPGYHTIPVCRSGLLKFQPKREDLPCRCIKDSFTTAVVPISSLSKRERYINHLARVRVGRLMEDLDLFAVWICHRYVKVPKLPRGVPLPYVFVTLLVDKVDFYNFNTVDADVDIEFCGHVSWVGRSSMEITIYMRQQQRNITKTILMMVARNATNTGSAPVNELQPCNEAEQLCFDDAVKRQERRGRKAPILRPSHNDEKLMFDIFRRTNGTDIVRDERIELPENSAWMSQSFQTTLIHPFPDNRNSQNNIFGGYVMRNAVEISFMTASIYTQSRPFIECIMDIAFLSPIKVHSFLKMTAHVVYTFEQFMQILTVVQVMDANTFEEVTTNTFNITFRAEQNVKEVLPSSYQETLWYINGRNKFQDFQQLKAKRNTKSLKV